MDFYGPMSLNLRQQLRQEFNQTDKNCCLESHPQKQSSQSAAKGKLKVLQGWIMRMSSQASVFINLNYFKRHG